MKHSFLAYGLTLASDGIIPGLAELRRIPQHPDIHFCFGAEPAWVTEAKRLRQRSLSSLVHNQETANAALRMCAYGEEEFFGLAFSDGSEFVLDASAARVWGTCAPPLVVEDLTTYLVGPVMGFILRRRGRTPLHACTMAIADSAIALSGEGGAGKSTTAAALALRGVPVLCEDVSPIWEIAGDFKIPPGYPRICLWPEAVKMLLGSSDVLPKITPTWEKRYLALDGRKTHFVTEPKSLSAIYFLDPRVEEAGAPRIEEMKPSDGLLRLVENSYAKRLISKEQKAAEFDVLSRLATRVAFRKITPHSDEAKLDVLCDLILENASKLGRDTERAVNRS